MKAKADMHWKASPISQPPFFVLSCIPCDHEILHQPAASCMINILPKKCFPPLITIEILIVDVFNWHSTVSLCFICTYPILPLCHYLQGGGGIHGATLQTPALRWQETGVWRQEEHLHGASASYWEWEGRCLKWYWINQMHHNSITGCFIAPLYSCTQTVCIYIHIMTRSYLFTVVTCQY